MATMAADSLHSHPEEQPRATKPSPRKRTRRPPPAPTNVLILVVPSLVLHSSLLPAFHAHFATYGTLHAWTPLPAFGRVVCVYDTEAEAQAARQEMDGFFWADEVDLQARGLDPGQAYEPLRAYYGPPFPPSCFAHLAQAAESSQAGTTANSNLAGAVDQHLAVPSSGRNFLISPPGSPPVGWEQIEEDSPNTRTWHQGDEPPTPRTRQIELEELKKAASPDQAWADELARALRFLSVDAGGGEDDEADLLADEGEDTAMREDLDGDGDGDGDGEERLGSTTHLVLAPAPIPALSPRAHLLPGAGGGGDASTLRPAVTVSSPVPTTTSSAGSSHPPTPPSTTATPPPGASKISSVKATIEAMLPRGDEAADIGRDQLLRGGPRFIPTATPPLA